MNKCLGCGYKLQSDNKKALGYVPKNKLEEATLCERCFKIIHYNDAKVVTLPIDTNKILKEVNNSSNHVLFLIDLLNINQKTLELYFKVKRPKTLLISKCDIIPYSFNKNKILNWLKEYYKIEDEIIFISALKNKNIYTLLNYLKAKDIKTSYLLGFTNVGKSSLVNKIVNLEELNYQAITTSLIPNTTLDFIHLKINDNLTLIDSPGFALENNIYANDDLTFVKKVNPKKFLKPITYQLALDTSILIEDKIRITNLEKKNNFTFYLSNLLKLTKVYNNERLTELKSKIIIIPKNHDVVICGLGFINVKQETKIKIYISDLNLIEIRKSFFKKV